MAKTSLYLFENAVIAKNYRVAEEQLVNVLRAITTNNLFIRNLAIEDEVKRIGVPPFQDNDPEVNSAQYTERLANAVTQLYCDEQYKPSDNALFHYLTNKSAITSLFLASSYGNLDHILHRLDIIKPGTSENSSLNHFKIVRLLMCYNLYSGFAFPWVAFQNTDYDQLITTAMIGLTARAHLCISTSAAAHKDRVLENLTHFKNVNISSQALMNTIVGPWFLCSYSMNPERHEFKKAANHLMKAHFEQCLPEKTKKKMAGHLKASKQKIATKHDKPTLLVMLEYYPSGHAMYRCYHPLLSKLKQRFNTVAVALEGINGVDDKSRQDFDQVHLLKQDDEVATVIDWMVKQKPAGIIYTSLGMNPLITQLASQRIANTQILLPGHPASSFLDTMDYLIPVGLEPVAEQLQQYCSEKVETLCQPGDSLFVGVEPHKALPGELPHKQVFDNKIRVAINGVIHKVTAELITFCQDLQKSTEKELQFVFFMSAPDRLMVNAGKRLVENLLPGAEVTSFMAYPKYLQVLKNCDLALPTFPFGASNSNVDCMLLGVPKLVLKGTNDLASFTDETVWHLFGGIDERLFADDLDQLKQKTLALIEDEALRGELSEALKKIDVNKQLFDEGKIDASGKIFTDGIYRLVMEQ